MCNDTITATGVFSAQELWKYSKGKGKILKNEALLFQPFLLFEETYKALPQLIS